MHKITTFIILLASLISTHIFAQEDTKIEHFGSITIKELNTTKCPIDTTAKAAFLINKIEYILKEDDEKGYILIKNVHQRIKIYSSDKTQLGNITLKYYSPKEGKKKWIEEIEGYTFYNEDGSLKREKVTQENIFEERVNKYYKRTKVAFPKVKEGAIIDLKYTQYSDLIAIDFIPFQEDYPTIDYKATVAIPDYIIFLKKRKGLYKIDMQEEKVTASSESIGSGPYSGTRTVVNNVYTFEDQNIPAFNTREPRIYSVEIYRPGIDFELARIYSTQHSYKDFTSTWENVCKTISKSPNFGNQLKKGSYYKEDLERVIANCKTDLDKVNAIFDFVQQHIKWNQYIGIKSNDGVKKAYKDHVGSCAEINMILTAMLRDAGLNANPVLVSTRDNGVRTFPTLNGFNYIISIVHLEDKPILLDATDDFALPNILPFRAINWQGREIISKNKSEWVNLNPVNYAKKITSISMGLNSDGAIKGVVRRTFTNHESKKFRENSYLKSDEKLITKIEDKYPLSVDRYSIRSPKNRAVSRDMFQFHSDKLYSRIDNKMYVRPLICFREDYNPFKSKKRVYPIDYVYPQIEKYIITFAIPKGATINSLPEDINLEMSDQLCTYSYKVKKLEGAVVVESELRVNTSAIPSEYYTEFREFYQKVVDKQNETIGITEPEQV
ncbi:transglutaminase domain-containing protein [Prolixibacteraceae bacterium]|nr:transglutaminase domain-containing protein [Prolixibacteraceae bacterium]